MQAGMLHDAVLTMAHGYNKTLEYLSPSDVNGTEVTSNLLGASFEGKCDTVLNK